MGKELYMLALTPSKKVNDQLELLRHEFADRYKAKAALKTPLHITLVAPFHLEVEDEEELLSKLDKLAGHGRFLCSLGNFGSFSSPEVLYVEVNENKDLRNLQEALFKLVHDSFDISAKYQQSGEFTPHVTIGRKDIPKGSFPDIIKEYSTLSCGGQFECKAFYLWKHDGKKWEVLSRFPLAPNNSITTSDFIGTLDSPLGKLKLIASNENLTGIEFTTESEIKENPNQVIIDCKNQLTEYFQGTRRVFDLPMKPFGTGFQQKVWNVVFDVPFGEINSYLAVSKKIGNEKAIRAVGGANGKNPIPIIIPCHRIVGNNGKLVGYSGGLWRKEWLLKHEADFGGQQSLF